MPNVIRVALPGFNALTDTNLDHFALYSDQDNVLIKELTRGSITVVGNGSGVTQTIAHNLGYIPFFLAFTNSDSLVGNNWTLAPHYAASASVPPYAVMADTTNINFIVNDTNTYTFKYYIFYDDISNSGTPSITESVNVIKVAKSGVNALISKNPNDYIFHSDLNTFKILKEGNATISYTTDGSYSFNHGASLTSPTSFLLFIKFPDGHTTIIPGKGQVYSYDSNWNAWGAYITTTQIGIERINGTNTATSLSVKYYIFETPL